MFKKKVFFRKHIVPTPITTTPKSKGEKPVSDQNRVASPFSVSANNQTEIVADVDTENKIDATVVPPNPPMFKIPKEDQDEINREYVEQLRKVMAIRSKSIANIEVALNDSRFIKKSFWTTFVVCLVLLFFGLASGVTSIILASKAIQAPATSVAQISSTPGEVPADVPENPTSSTNTTGTAIILGILSGVSILGVFVLRPLDSLERNAVLYPLVNGIVTMFWFQISETNDNAKVKKIVADFVANLSMVLDKHNEATKKYIELLSSQKEKPPEEGEGEEGKEEKEDGAGKDGAEKEKDKKEQGEPKPPSENPKDPDKNKK